jgi:hypothetical protein
MSLTSAKNNADQAKRNGSGDNEYSIRYCKRDLRRAGMRSRTVIVSTLTLAALCAAPALAKRQSVPVVKCPFSSQASAGRPVAVSASASVLADVPTSWASRVSYYTVGVLGAFAPRGWHCAGADGSGGTVLTVVPGNMPTAYNLDHQIGISVELAWGFTSGRFTVLETGGPLFLEVRTLARQSADPDLRNVSVQPIRGESVTRVSPRVARFCDPPGIRGVGNGSGGAYRSCGLATISPSGFPGKNVLPNLHLVSVTMRDPATISVFVTLNSRP